MQLTNPKDQTEATMASIGEGSETGNIRNVIRINEGEIKNHLGWVASVKLRTFVL